ncbi:MAG: adenosylcobinamide-GDP ribazoletransferase [Enterobacteriaceae bacterium]|jgi:adenosylcobinamide-GDP ribazoletransferase|nr:adenosylcobinamide-GDP ribazoletransferase [Enterobacteriaceae bacterium]
MNSDESDSKQFGLIRLWLVRFFAAMQFITRIPVPAKWAEGIDFRQSGRGVPVFPLVGLIVGVIAALISVGISQTGGMFIGAISYVLALALLTGGFHLDGLADTCDGIFSARTRERMLEIMKDSRLGTHGGLALVFCIGIKTLAVLELSYHTPIYLLALLICAPIAGRTAMVLLMYGQRYAREGEGLGNIYIGKITARETLCTLLIGFILIAVIGGKHGVFAIAITLIMVFGLAGYFRHHLGGQTGDTLGAAEELGEVIFLLALIWS